MQTDLCNVIINEKKVFKILTTVFEQFGRDKSFFYPPKSWKVELYSIGQNLKTALYDLPNFFRVWIYWQEKGTYWSQCSLPKHQNSQGKRAHKNNQSNYRLLIFRAIIRLFSPHFWTNPHEVEINWEEICP